MPLKLPECRIINLYLTKHFVMKKIILLLFITSISHSFAFPIFTIITSSWQDSSFTSYGSTQWVDVTVNTSGGYSSSDSATVYLFNTMSEKTFNPIYTRIARMKFDKTIISHSAWNGSKWVTVVDDSTGFLSLPLNGDGVSRRIAVTMPTNFLSGQFSVNIMIGKDVYGEFPSLSGIEEYSQHQQIKQINYYNELGQSILMPSGLIIKEFIYQDGYIVRKKIYIVNGI